ncbi:hypothetical protein [Maricaulis alexandrii]|uniref:hypothetical protein n=1 Tax=Maricaulis alexandrii TaxID=2570354 RepID=UPI001108C1C1|nr:hypothetical protein [Maricaulis alexandrii]
MSFLNPSSRAEASDSLALLTACGTGLVALIYAFKVAEAYASSGLASWLDIVQLVGGVLVLLVFLPLFYFLKTRFGGTTVSPWKSDSFFGTVLKRAGLAAFGLVLMSMIILTTMDRLVLANVTPEVLLDALIALALIGFSASFFLLGRDMGEGCDTA